MKKYIKLDEKEKQWIMSAFEISRVMVNYALGFDKKRGNSDLAKRIRQLALQRGGVLVNELPVFETIHNSNGVMRQTFPNGAEIMVDTSAGFVDLHDKKGTLVKALNECSVKQLYELQELAASL